MKTQTLTTLPLLLTLKKVSPMILKVWKRLNNPWLNVMNLVKYCFIENSNNNHDLFLFLNGSKRTSKHNTILEIQVQSLVKHSTCLNINASQSQLSGLQWSGRPANLGGPKLYFGIGSFSNYLKALTDCWCKNIYIRGWFVCPCLFLAWIYSPVNSREGSSAQYCPNLLSLKYFKELIHFTLTDRRRLARNKRKMV